MNVGDKVYGPDIVLNGAGKRVVMDVVAVDTMPEQTAKRGDGMRYVNCGYSLNDVQHLETFAENSLSPVS